MVSEDLRNEYSTDVEDYHSWNKVVRESMKAGFRDGASDGREVVFQNGFDQGYLEGFKNGFVIGRYKGALKAAAIQNRLELDMDTILANSRKGWCQLCNDKDEETIDNIVSKQTIHSTMILKDLHNKYKDICKVSLPCQLE